MDSSITFIEKRAPLAPSIASGVAAGKLLLGNPALRVVGSDGLEAVRACLPILKGVDDEHRNHHAAVR